MSTPMTASQLLAVLLAEGVNAVEYRSWRTHNRDGATGKVFGPVKGVVVHHTAGTNSLATVYDGRSDLPGPLCHTHLSKTGVASMISAGRANHAGTFAQNAVDAMIAEASVHPAPDVAEPVDANDLTYGIEIENLGNGTDPYPEVQYTQAVRWATAICRFYGWSENSVIGHKEGTRRKTDPSFSMNMFRTDVRNALSLPAGQWGNLEEDVALTDAEIEKIAERVWLKDGLIANPLSPPSTNAFIVGATALNNIEIVARRAEATVNDVKVTVDSLLLGGVDLDALAEKVADVLHARLAG